MTNTALENLLNCEEPANYIYKDGVVIAAPEWYWTQRNVEEQKAGSKLVLITVHFEKLATEAELSEIREHSDFPEVLAAVAMADREWEPIDATYIVFNAAGEYEETSEGVS